MGRKSEEETWKGGKGKEGEISSLLMRTNQNHSESLKTQSESGAVQQPVSSDILRDLECKLL